MGQLLHGSARTTAALRRTIQHSQESIARLAARYDLNAKTVAKWRKRTTVEDAPMGPRQLRSTVLTEEEEAMIMAFRQRTLLALDDCLYALQPSIPHLTRSSLHRCLQGSVARITLPAIIRLSVHPVPFGNIHMKQNKSSFKWRHFEPTIILLCVRWYCRYQLSYRDLEEMMGERGLAVDHTTVFRWVQKYAPEINKRMRPHLKLAGASYRIDETYIKVGRQWKYLYRALDKEGSTIEFMLSAKRDIPAAKRFFKKMMRADHRRLPFSISVDKHASYPDAFTTSQEEKVLPKDCNLRRTKYLTNIVEQDHRFIRRRWRAMQCFRSFHTAERTIEGVESLHMIRKGQVKRLDRNDAMGQVRFVESLFGVAA